jgi:2-phospho-L-lactate guanylyltransferase
LSRHIVIAARGGPAAKTRLAGRLDTAAREALVEAMLADMLTALAAARVGARVHVATPTPALARIAARAGAVVMLEHGVGGLNAAFDGARRRIGAAEPQAAVMLLPADLPRFDPAEADAVLNQAAPGRLVLVPADADGGTGALAMAAATPLPLAFGPGSFGRHLAAARTLGLEAHVVHAAGLSFDLDRPADLDVLLALGGGPRTLGLLRDGRAAA